MITFAKSAILLVEGLLFVVAGRIMLEVLMSRHGLPYPLAALAELAWVVALCLITRAWHRQGAPRHSWTANLRAGVLATGLAPLYLGSMLFFRFDRHAAGLLVLTGAGILCLAEFAARRLQRLEHDKPWP